MRSIAADVFEEPATAQSGRDDRGDTLALLILWPALVVAILVLLVHAFIVTNAQAEAEVAASSGLKAAWRSAANEDFRSSYDTVAEVYEDSAYNLPGTASQDAGHGGRGRGRSGQSGSDRQRLALVDSRRG